MTLWIDVEDLFDYARHLARPSGIQRLSFELYRALVACPDVATGFVRHDPPRGTMRVVDWAEVEALYEGLIAGHTAIAGPAAAAGPSTVAGADAQLVVSAAQPTPMPLGLGPIRHLISRLPMDLRRPLSQGTHHQIAVLRHMVEAIRALPSLWRRPMRPLSAAVVEPVETLPGEAEPPCWGTDLRDIAKPGDTLCCFGSPWFHPAYSGLVSRIVDATGVRFALLVYDLIPVLRPEFCDRGLVRIFDSFIRRCLPAADIILAISEATARDIEAWAERDGIALRARPVAIPIGTGFVPAPATALPEALSPGGYALFVSTIEARKNHLQAFRIWRQMLEEMPRDQVPTLVFAGRVGWMVADLMQAIENTNWLDGKLVLVREPDDSTLSALYEHCRFTLFTSHYEGWGLPVSESLAFGKTCIASDRTSVPEAGGPFCLYVDPENTTAAYAVVRRAIEEAGVIPALEAKIAADYRPTSWTRTAEAVLRAVEPATSSP